MRLFRRIKCLRLENELPSKQKAWYHNLPWTANCAEKWHHYGSFSEKGNFFKTLLLLFGLWCHRCRAGLGCSSSFLTGLVLAVNPGVLPLHQLFQLRLQSSDGKTSDSTWLMAGDAEDRVVNRKETVRKREAARALAFIKKSLHSGDLGPQHHTGKSEIG